MSSTQLSQALAHLVGLVRVSAYAFVIQGLYVHVRFESWHGLDDSLEVIIHEDKIMTNYK